MTVDYPIFLPINEDNGAKITHFVAVQPLRGVIMRLNKLWQAILYAPPHHIDIIT